MNDAPINLPPAQTRPKSALIVEGGAMRGAWAAGVLGALYEMNHCQFDLVVAGSSGACSAAYFVAGMVKPGLEIWRQHVGDQKLLRRTNWLRFKPMVDLAYLIDHCFKKSVPLPVDAFATAKTRFQIVLTSCETGQPFYFTARDEWVFEALKASSSLPFATLGYSFVAGVPYADGGISDAIPIRYVLSQGATDITVILTHGPEYRMGPTPRIICRLAYPWFPKVAEAWMRRHQGYNESLDLLAHPPVGVRIRMLRPMKPLPVTRFTDDSRRLRAAVDRGQEEATEQMRAQSQVTSTPS
jgi:predicted patatin/cPLA2 family phospholipase